MRTLARRGPKVPWYPRDTAAINRLMDTCPPSTPLRPSTVADFACDSVAIRAAVLPGVTNLRNSQDIVQILNRKQQAASVLSQPGSSLLDVTSGTSKRQRARAQPSEVLHAGCRVCRCALPSRLKVCAPCWFKTTQDDTLWTIQRRKVEKAARKECSSPPFHQIQARKAVERPPSLPHLPSLTFSCDGASPSGSRRLVQKQVIARKEGSRAGSGPTSFENAAIVRIH